MLWWWWNQALILSLLSTDSIWPKPGLCSYRIHYKTGLKPKEAGCILNQSFLQKISSKRWQTKKLNLMQLINIGRLPWKCLLGKRICGITLRVRNTRHNFRIATSYLTKFKKVSRNILRQREDASLDFSFCLTNNFFKF